MSRKRVLTIVGAAVAAGAVVAGIMFWSSATRHADSPVAVASTSPGATATPLPTPTPGSTASVNEDVPIEVAIDEAGVVAGSVSARIVDVVSFDAQDSQEPGQLAGPAVTVTIEVANGSTAAVELVGSSVNLEYGPQRTPAPPVGDPVATGFPSSVGPGKTVSGQYSFSLPVDQRGEVRVILDLVSGESQLIFVGQLTRD